MRCVITGTPDYLVRIDFDRFEEKFFAVVDFQAMAGTLWTEQFAGGGLVAVAAILTGDFNRDPFKMQLCAVGKRPFAEHIPIKLDGIIDSGRPLPHDDEQVSDALGILRLSMPDGNFENTLGDG
jgi:hypothetical protein